MLNAAAIDKYSFLERNLYYYKQLKSPIFFRYDFEDWRYMAHILARPEKSGYWNGFSSKGASFDGVTMVM